MSLQPQILLQLLGGRWSEVVRDPSSVPIIVFISHYGSQLASTLITLEFQVCTNSQNLNKPGKFNDDNSVGVKLGPGKQVRARDALHFPCIVAANSFGNLILCAIKQN